MTLRDAIPYDAPGVLTEIDRDLVPHLDGLPTAAVDLCRVAQSLLASPELAGGFGAWPDGDLRICTVDVGNGRRFVVDRTSGTPLSTAVSASCAVPGLFAPQRIVGRTVVDGGVHSTTNVDALD